MTKFTDSVSERSSEQKWCRLRITEWGGLAVLISYFNSEKDKIKLKLSKKTLQNVLYTLRIVNDTTQNIHTKTSLPIILECESPVIKRSVSPHNINECYYELKKQNIVQKNISFPEILLQTINLKELQTSLEEELAAKAPILKVEDIVFQKPTRDNSYNYLRPVSYTHLTLPTILLVQISVVAVSLKKKKKQKADLIAGR
eukprot:TRINITY_DN26968_c0_g1_i5.p1 TRINITY_DN26968_c0_g1~~TRINITY_DN26968_c0_g1_i5.p1  ORF type:complete len:200 (-),score=43.09 TRINITY_DN26968_c0_g1_i5:88-687(-)